MTIRKCLPFLVLCLSVAGCGTEAALFNSAFLNTVSGDVVPRSPGPVAAFVLVRCVNETTQPVEFAVRVDRQVLKLDANGLPQLDEFGRFVTELRVERIAVQTGATGQLRDVGVLFSCRDSPVTRVGLGENFLPSDIAARVGGAVVGGATGFGIPVGQDVPPLELAEGNFNCGDTVIYRAFQNRLRPGGVALETLLLPGSEQPSVFTGPSTFGNFAELLDSVSTPEAP
ncbi:MAG: hypothetical protein ACE5EX_08320 [Phycisphaerae bacterium]